VTDQSLHKVGHCSGLAVSKPCGRWALHSLAWRAIDQRWRACPGSMYLDGLLCGHSDEHDGPRDECGESDDFSVIAMLNGSKNQHKALSAAPIWGCDNTTYQK